MERILVCIDGSPRMEGVLHTAVELATKAHAKLVLFRGVGVQTEVPPQAWSIAPDSVRELLQGEALTFLQRCAESLPTDIVAGLHVGIGAPWQAICEAAKAEQVDLIVIGSHGYDALDRLVGTTAAKVVNHADRSVLVVRAHERMNLD
jgi:nucleotide-binding universal stress UspA family protein